MRKFKYQDPSGEYVITEEEIIKEYYPYWIEEMKKAHKENLISIESCIEDFIAVYWAEIIEE